jgi:hypothetical protein
MSLNTKQKRFAHEYAVDHNGAQAAIRAGYSPRAAKETAFRLMANVAVKQLVAKLDGEKRVELGVEAAEVLQRLEWLWEQASELVPKIWKGEPVTWLDPEVGDYVQVTQFRSAAVAVKTVELMLRLAGLETSRSTVEMTGEVVYTLTLDRDLSAENDPTPKESEYRS